MQPTFRILFCGHNNNSRLRYHSLFHQRSIMALSNTAQPINTSLRKIAVVVATAVAGMSAYDDAAETPKKEETITVTAAPAAQESAWGPAPTIAAKRTATATKTDTPIEKTPQSISVVTREEMDMKQPGTVKQALAYTPSVFATRGASTTMSGFLFVVLRPPVQ
jgi:iron complex outermembrane receptor protein